VPSSSTPPQPGSPQPGAARPGPPRSGSPNSALRRLDGLLFFPVTAFGPDGGFNPGAYHDHVQARLADGPGAVFAACGTGEFPALDPDEARQVVAAAVAAVESQRVIVQTAADLTEAAASAARPADSADSADPTAAPAPGTPADPAGPGGSPAGRIPVIGGCGYGTALATWYARAAEQAGADGLLVLPPTGVDGSQQGLLRHYTALAESTDLDLILYQRDTTVFAPETVVRLAEVPNIVGFKDGRGDLDLMLRIVSAVRASGQRDFQYFNGMPTAEATQQAYRAIGVPLYSSAVFCFAPDIALSFYRALAAEDRKTVDTLVDVFFRPYVELRRVRPGYAVSLVKAATRAVGHPVGQVRAPLDEPAPEHVAELLALVDRAREALG
jgi:5-dehydro-4-deoxyglucarate dehydratase